MYLPFCSSSNILVQKDYSTCYKTHFTVLLYKMYGTTVVQLSLSRKGYIKRFTVPATKPVSKSPKRIRAYNEFMAALFTRLMYNFLSVFIMLESQLAISYMHIWYTTFDFQSHKQLDHFFFSMMIYIYENSFIRWGLSGFNILASTIEIRF